MKIILFEICFITLTTLCIANLIDNEPLGVPGIPINRTKSFRSFTCTNTDIGPTCGDCRTLMACAGSGAPLYQEDCTSTRSKPYCANNVCSSKPARGCEVNFRCTSEGTFPDPSDCTIYHYCNNTGSVPKSFKCPSDYVFSTQTKLCSRFIPCQTVNCLNDRNRWIALHNNTGYYAFCGHSETVMFKCMDEDNYVFNPISNKCEFNCQEAINYPDRTNCNGYINCQVVDDVFVATSIMCPPNYHYDEVQQLCTRGGDCTSQVTTPKPIFD